jgi:predicted DsbA family dithiol-disulfide isomerase
VGLPLHLERIRTVPNTLRAHALIGAARPDGQQHALAGALFRAYFVEGRDLGDDAVLRELAHAEGLDTAQIDEAWTQEALQQAAEADLSVREMGIGGVPFFIVGRRIAVSGAQGAEALLEALRQASA